MSITSSNPVVPPVTAVHPSPVPPWMHSETFPIPPMPLTYGYRKGDQSHQCSGETLVDQIQRDIDKKISLVWTPESSRLAPPEEQPWLFDALRIREVAHLKQARFYAIANTIMWGLLALVSAIDGWERVHFSIFNLTVLGIIPLLEVCWKMYHLRSFTVETVTTHIPEVRYMAWLGRFRAPWTWALVGCITSVGVAQFVVGLLYVLDRDHSSILAAGIVKPAIWAGEWWRLLTGTFLHANLIHFLFNLAALFSLGKVLEVTYHRMLVPLVFVLSALSGSIWSLLLWPDTTSVGASGGIMGLLGFVLILAWTQRQSFPHTLRRSLVKSTVYIAIAGLVAFQVIDNSAHVGGFVIGSGLGLLFTRDRTMTFPVHISRTTYAASIIASAVIVATTLLCLYHIFAA
jgi:membrane associated rhomboid family serine protease